MAGDSPRHAQVGSERQGEQLVVKMNKVIATVIYCVHYRVPVSSIEHIDLMAAASEAFGALPNGPLHSAPACWRNGQYSMGDEGESQRVDPSTDMSAEVHGADLVFWTPIVARESALADPPRCSLRTAKSRAYCSEGATIWFT
jgi:hypothetical protein